MNRDKLCAIIVCCIALVTGITAFMITGNKEGPVISVGSTNIIYTEGDDIDLLLQDVTAYDEKDKDVTSTVVVERIFVTPEGKLHVVYAASDKEGHVTRSYKVVNYKKLQDNFDDEQKVEEAE